MASPSFNHADPHSDDLDATARAWVLKLASGAASAADAAEARAWMAASPAHHAAFTRARALWQDTGALENAFRQQKTNKRTHWRLVLTASAAAAAAVLGVVLAPFFMDSVTVLRADYRAPSGEVRSFQLTDGSTVWLDSGAAINVQLSPQRREIEILRGRAFFEVSADPNRPFSVTADSGSATAVGTAFSVQRNADEVIVAVSEGRVRTTQNNSSALLSPGEQGGWSKERILPTQPANIRSLHAWTAGRVIIQNQPLEEAIAALDLYHPGVIFVRDRGDVRVSGQFDIHRTQQGLSALAESQELKVSHWGPWITVLSK